MKNMYQWDCRSYNHGRGKRNVHRLSVVSDGSKGVGVKADGLANERPVINGLENKKPVSA